MSYLGAALFQSETRSAVLEQLFLKNVTASVSELARRTGLSVRAVAKEVLHLRSTALVQVETVAGAHVVKANLRHPATGALRALLRTPAEPAADEAKERSVRESLAAWGAPLAGVKKRKVFSLHETLLHGLVAAKHDGTVLRVLPILLARNLEGLDWSELKEEARRKGLKSELGMLAELTADLLQRDDVRAEVAELKDLRRKTFRFMPEPKNRFERELAMQRAPAAAKRWGFWMNVPEDSFRAALEKHFHA